MIPFLEVKDRLFEDKEQNLLFIAMFDSDKQFTDFAYTELNSKELIIPHMPFYMAIQKSNRLDKKYAKSSVSGMGMHDVIIGEKPPPGYKTDHGNSNGLDNRRENLMLVTDGGNSHNRVKIDNTSCKYYGVSLTTYKKWCSAIVFQGIRYHLGEYDDIEEAVKIHDIYAVHFYKDGARLNTKDGEYFVNKEEVDDIYKNGIPEKYKRVKRGENRTLPQCIYNKGDRWWYDKTYNYKTYTKSYKSQEEAEEGLRELIAQKDEEERQRKIQIENNIVRNEEGIAILHSHNNEGEVNLELRVDDHVWRRFIHNNWSRSRGEDTYVHGYVDNVVADLHTHIWRTFKGPIPEGMSVDHINSYDPTDNRLSNLRLGNRSLQAHNTIREKKSCIRFKRISIAGGKFSLKYKNKYVSSYYYEEDAIREYNRLAKEEYGDDAALIEVGDTKTTIDDYFSDLSLEFLESLNTVQELRQVFIMKPKWKKNSSELNMENFKEYKSLAMKLREEELENDTDEEENRLKNQPDKYSVEFIKLIKTVKVIKQVFRDNEIWRKKYNVCYKHITGLTLEKYKSIAIEAKEDSKTEIKVNGGFKPVVLRVQRPDILKLESQEQLASIELPKIDPLKITPMKALSLSKLEEVSNPGILKPEVSNPGILKPEEKIITLKIVRVKV